MWAASFAFHLSFYLLLPGLPLYARTLGISDGRIGLIIGFLAVSASIALAALILTAAQRETLARAASTPFALHSLLSRAALFPSFVVLCFMTTYGALAAFLAIYAQARGANPGIFFLVMAVVVALARGYAGLISDRLGRAPVAAAGQATAAAALVVLAVGDGITAFAAAGALYGLGLGAAQPALTAWAMDLVGSAERGKAMGTFYAAFELGIAAGAVGFGAVLARTSFAVMFLATVGMAMLAAALAASRWQRRSHVHPHRGEDEP